MRSTTETIIIGAGQAGLALSRLLAGAGRDHVLLERGQVAERWRSERWDSLRLLTPNWMTRLPDGSYDGPDPDGFMTANELADHLERYASGFDAPVETGVTVRRVAARDDGYLVDTDRGGWIARNVVVATGAADLPQVPGVARALTPAVDQISPSSYRRPDALAPGGVLVVGASASGAQIAQELAEAGRDVTLAVGRHTRMPRRYRGRDIMWWLDGAGVFDDQIDQVRDPVSARRSPSLQLVGRADHRDLDLRVMADTGVRVVGRLVGCDGPRVTFADDLADTTASAEVKLGRVLDRVDAAASRLGLDHEPTFAPAARPAPIHLDGGGGRVDLRAEGIGTVLWATGHRRAYPWLDVPVFDPSGEIAQWRGATPAPGLFVLGLRFQTRRNSNFIDGVGHDALLVAHHICRRNPARVAA